MGGFNLLITEILVVVLSESASPLPYTVRGWKFTVTINWNNVS